MKKVSTNYKEWYHRDHFILPQYVFLYLSLKLENINKQDFINIYMQTYMLLYFKQC